MSQERLKPISIDKKKMKRPSIPKVNKFKGSPKGISKRKLTKLYGKMKINDPILKNSTIRKFSSLSNEESSLKSRAGNDLSHLGIQ